MAESLRAFGWDRDRVIQNPGQSDEHFCSFIFNNLGGRKSTQTGVASHCAIATFAKRTNPTPDCNNGRHSTTRLRTP
jgi:hypothetical protein